MNTTSKSALPASDIAELERLFTLQKALSRQDSVTTAKQRIAHLKALSNALIKHQDKLAEAVSADYGHRSADEFKMAELLFTLESLKYCRKNLRTWMQPEKRQVASLNMPAQAQVTYQPLGVIGIIVPWNYPIFLAIGPLMYALAAGNRVMIKMSSATPRLNEAFKAMIASIFAQDRVAVITGKGDISVAFPKLPFDQITFTGSTQVGRIVMAEASKNLTPVLLELGGKSPTIVHPSFPLATAAERIAMGKCWNAGQTCVAPDYLYLARGKSAAFVDAFKHSVAKMYPSLCDNPDYTSILNDKQYQRLQGYLDDARQQGARVIEINPANEDFSASRKMPITLVTGVTPDMALMQHEIFGPILPIMEYDHISDAIEAINNRPRPLALYYFDYDKSRGDQMVAATWSGGVTINDVMTHVVIDDLPFGGIGAAGMGRYHGPEGFKSMSNVKSVLRKSRIYTLRFIHPPFNKLSHDVIRKYLLK